MQTFSPRMPFPLDAPGNGFSIRREAPGHIGDSLFQNLLRRLNEHEEGFGVENLLPFSEPQGNLGAGTRGGGLNRGHNLFGVSNGRVNVPPDDLPRLARFLEGRGFQAPEINALFKALADKDGNVPLDRLMGGLHNLITQKKPATESLVLDRTDIPRVKEALFKMGLGADQVRDVMAKALNADGRISLRGLTSALGSHFSGVKPDTGLQLAELLQREMGIGFRPVDMEKAAKEAGLEQALNRFAQGSSDAARQAAKLEISTLMLSKGVPAEDIRKLFETLSVRSGDSVVRKAEPLSLQDEPRTGIGIPNGRPERQQASWQERIIEILNREEFLSGRKAGYGATAGQQQTGALKPNRVMEEAVSGLLKSRQTDINPAVTRHPESTHIRGTAIPAGETAGEAAKTATGGSRAGRADESGFPRQATAGDISVSRADFTESSRQPAAAARSQAPATVLPEPLPRIVDRMVWMVNRGEQASRIQISPPELGRLDLSIVIKQGHLQAHVSAENPMVKEIIEANLQQLKQQLGNLGFTVERFDVSAGLDDRRFAEFQARTRGGQRSRQERNGKAEVQAVDGLDSASRPARNAMGELYRINVRV